MNREEEIFSEALGLPPGDRAAFLEPACGGDAALRERIRALLAGHAEMEQRFPAPTVARAAPVAEEKSGFRISHYKLLEKIGEGGCGVVWMAEQEEPVRRRVALKVIKLGMDTKAVIARFEAERQALAMMDHPNIAKVLDAGTTDAGRPFFVMELVRGIAITRFCDEEKLTTPQRLELFIQVCHAIQHAHQKGIIHRDIKPSNILVTRHDDLVMPKVIDFGIAKATQGRLTDATVFTAFEQFIGTPAYMSPEQSEFNALDIDTRSDVYSLGVLLYELLTGRPPFDPKTLVSSGLDEIRRIIREVEPPRPSTRLSTLTVAERTSLAALRGTIPSQLSTLMSGDLDWIVMKALEKSRVRRYESASAFAADVQRYLGHEPVMARPPSSAYLLGKLIRRHKVAFSAAGAIAAVLVIGAGVSTWQAIRATRAEHTATEAREGAERGEREQARLRGVESELRGRAEAQSQLMRHQAYARDISLVQQALAIDNLGRAQQVLDRQRPKAGEVDLRGWEWRYLWQFCQSEATAILSAKKMQVMNLATSSDGKWLVTAEVGAAGKVELWNLTERAELRVPTKLADGYTNICFASREPLLMLDEPVGGDSEGSGKGRLKLRNVATGEVVGEWLTPGQVLRGFFSSDDTRLLTHHPGEVILWRVPGGEKIQSYQVPLGATVVASKTLDLFVAEGFEGSIRLVEVATGESRWNVKNAAEHSIGLAISPDGKIVAAATAGAESIIRLWDVATGKALGDLPGHRAYCRPLLFSTDGKTLISSGMDQTIRLWDIATRRLVRTLHGHRSAVGDLDLLPDGTIVSASADGTVRFWDTNPVRAPGATSAIPGKVLTWMFARDSQSVITIDAAGNIRRWSGRAFQQRTQLPSPPGRISPAAGYAVCWSTDASLIALARSGGVVEVWDWERGVVTSRIQAPAQRALPVAFREESRKLLLSYEDDDVSLRGLVEWDLASGAKTREWPRRAVRSEYVVSRDGRMCISRPTDAPRGFPNDGPLVRAERGPRWMIDLQTGEERNVEGKTFGSSNASFSSDGRWFAAPVIDRTIIWDTKTFEPVATLGGAFLGMHGAAFTPDDKRLAVTMTGADAVRIWDVHTWEPMLTLDAPGSIFIQTAFSPDGNVFGSRSYFGQLHLWRAPSWSEIEAAEKANLRN